ncbi:FRG domain-containing protein [Citrobacter cronae]|uniref:FRG domain-containing protein n=1 Tax=Citrobacter cronae TaxID=1748967 RepID=UPI0021CFF22B|nr:FRG domain-containing protein [Citrobacter cronae]MCU6173674.1 FRG domain-containing protein [Citrobacter cronae]
MEKIKSISDFIEIIKKEESFGVLYRGHSDKRYKLLPSAFRWHDKILNREKTRLDRELENNKINKNSYDREQLALPSKIEKEILKRERNAIRIFLSEHTPYTQYKIDSVLDGLALAQHHGMPTRLLDWSLSPLVALFFAVEKPSGNDAAVYIMRDASWLDETKLKKHSNLSVDDYIAVMKRDMQGKIFMPNHITPRIKAQHGVFSIHNEIKSEFKPDNITEITIDGSCTSQIKFELKQLGISEKTVYPDLYGLCTELKWLKFEGLD